MIEYSIVCLHNDYLIEYKDSAIHYLSLISIINRSMNATPRLCNKLTHTTFPHIYTHKQEQRPWLTSKASGMPMCRSCRKVTWSLWISETIASGYVCITCSCFHPISSCISHARSPSLFAHVCFRFPPSILHSPSSPLLRRLLFVLIFAHLLSPFRSIDQPCPSYY